jgi:hypothetical protein
MSVNLNDTNKIKEMKDRIYSSSSNKNQETVNPTTNENSNKVKPHLGIIKPQPFNPIESAILTSNCELSAEIDSMMKDVFVDYFKSKIEYQPNLGGINGFTCTLRFAYTDPNSVDKDDNRIFAINTLQKEIHNKYKNNRNDFAETIKIMNATNKCKSHAKVTISEDAKPYLENIIIRGLNGGIDWNNNCVIAYIEETKPNNFGHMVTNIYMDVSVNLLTLITMMHNGTEEDCPQYAENRKYSYMPYFLQMLDNYNFGMKIVRVDNKKLNQYCKSAGINYGVISNF